MPDLSEFEALSKRRGRPCSVGLCLDALEPEDRAKLQAALDTDGSIINTAAVAKWCQARGLTTTMQAVRTHRGGECRCGKA